MITVRRMAFGWRVTLPNVGFANDKALKAAAECGMNPYPRYGMLISTREVAGGFITIAFTPLQRR